MIEVVDLLYKNPHELIKTPNQEESMKHLLLEEVINGATVNPQLQQDIYDLISVPEPDPENIIWRRDILDDFLSNPALFDDLRAILGIHDEISKGMRNASRGGGSAVVSKKELTGRDSQIFKMRSYAECIVRTIEMYEETAKIIKPRRLTSEAFCKIKDLVNREIRKSETMQLKALAKELSESITLDTSFIISMDLNKYFCVEDVEMLELDSNPYNYKDPKKRAEFDSQSRIEYIGFDDIDEGDWQSYKLTTFAQPFTAMGDHLVERDRPVAHDVAGRPVDHDICDREDPPSRGALQHCALLSGRIGIAAVELSLAVGGDNEIDMRRDGGGDLLGASVVEAARIGVAACGDIALVQQDDGTDPECVESVGSAVHRLDLVAEMQILDRIAANIFRSVAG